MTADPVLFVGLGAMGTPMASQLAPVLARDGVPLLLCDADDARAAALAEELGATAVPSAELADTTAGVVVLMLPDSGVVESVLGGGLLDGLPEGAVVVDMSSSRPASTQALASLAAARGLGYVDAPVSGGVAKARDGSLAVMAGGEAEAVERVRPLLETMGGSVTHVGGPGAGHAVKALNNLLSAVGLAAAAEVLSVAANFGLEPQTVLDVLNGSTGRNQATEVKYERFVLSGAFDSGFAMRLMVKDLRTALELAHDTGTPVPLAAGALQEWTAALRALGDGADHTAVAAYVAGRAGTDLTTR